MSSLALLFPKLEDHPDCNPLCQVCHYKAYDYDTQLQKKEAWVAKQLGRWGKALRAIRSAPLEERLHYRSKTWLQSHFQEGTLSLGMYRSVQIDGRWGKEFVSWDSCPLHLKAIQEMVGNFRRELPRSVRRLDLLVGIWIGNPHCVLVFREGDRSVLDEVNWDSILVPPFHQIWFHVNSQVGRKIFGHRPLELVFSKPPASGFELFKSPQKPNSSTDRPQEVASARGDGGLFRGARGAGAEEEALDLGAARLAEAASRRRHPPRGTALEGSQDDHPAAARRTAQERAGRASFRAARVHDSCQGLRSLSPSTTGPSPGSPSRSSKS